MEHRSNVKDTCAFTYYNAILWISGYCIYISLYVDGGAAVPSGWKKQNICYLDTISSLGCLLPRNKYTALAPYFVSVSVGEGEYLLTHSQLCEGLGLNHTHLTVVIVIIT